MTEETRPESLPPPPQGPADNQAPAEAAPLASPPPSAAPQATPLQAAAPQEAAPGASPAAPEAVAPPAAGPEAPALQAAAPQEAAPAAPAQAAPAGPAPAPEAPVSQADRPTVIVRYGAMGMLGRFGHALPSWRCGQRVVIKSDRGMEMGEIVCAWGGCGAPGTVTSQIKGEIIRPVAHADEVEERHLQESARREFAFSKSCIASRSLPMKLVAVEHLFGGDRIVFYFVSESRVDFRALVRDLAHEFQTRIEMRQIGVRDEARLLGDYERCGRPLCCRAWIKELEPVSMKMAKIQKATLDPTKISGRCGRLMCCLRFEHATYRDLARNLPRKNTLVLTSKGPGKVVDTDIVAQLVGVLLGDGTRMNVPVEALRLADGSAAAPAEGAVPAAVGAEAPGDGMDDETRAIPESRLVSWSERDRPAPARLPDEQADEPPPREGAPESPPRGDAPESPPREAAPESPPREGAPEPPPPQAAPEARPSGGPPDQRGGGSRRGRRRRRGRGRGRPPEGGPGGRPPQGTPGGAPQRGPAGGSSPGASGSGPAGPAEPRPPASTGNPGPGMGPQGA